MHILWLDFQLLVTSQVRNTEDLVVEIIEMCYQTLPRKTDVWREERRELQGKGHEYNHLILHTGSEEGPSEVDGAEVWTCYLRLHG